VEKENKNKKENTQVKIATGLDVGTMTLILSRSDSDEMNINRNMFLRVDTDEFGMNDMSDMSFITSDDGQTYIIGDDAFKMANLFNKEVLRPMEKGMISPSEVDAIDVLALMIKNMFGDITDKDVYCSYSVPAEPIDADRSVTYHEKVFSRVLDAIGINHKSCNEAMAVIFSECKKEKFSGIGLSFGAGMCNIVSAYKAVEAFTFATSKSGDWIDTMVAKDLNITTNRVTNTKEKFLNLNTGYKKEKNKKRRRILEALTYYYQSMIDYTIKHLIKEFDSNFDLELDEEIPIVIAGGTSMIPGFKDLFTARLSNYDLPFDVSEIRMAKNPQTAISRGLLIKTMHDLGI